MLMLNLAVFALGLFFIAKSMWMGIKLGENQYARYCHEKGIKQMRLNFTRRYYRAALVKTGIGIVMVYCFFMAGLPYLWLVFAIINIFLALGAVFLASASELEEFGWQFKNIALKERGPESDIILKIRPIVAPLNRLLLLVAWIYSWKHLFM